MSRKIAWSDVDDEGPQEKRARTEEDERSSESDAFKIEEATIEEIQSAFRQKKLTSRELVDHYIKAIGELNPKIRAVIEVNPDAGNQADEADRERNLPGGCISSIHGIPVILKDNIATKDKTNTTAGSVVLLNSSVPRNAGVVARLRNSGAIILGKAGLTEWAKIRSLKLPDGWSARGGLVKNPYKLSGDVGGSSTGSAVCVAANLATVSLGTETNGSILVPSSLNGVVGIKPTVGLASRAGVIPITLRQDTTGPIGRTVSDAVHLLDGIVGYDPRDEITKDWVHYIPSQGFKQHLQVGGLEGKRLGNLWDYFQRPYMDKPSVVQTFQDHFSTMRQKGAVLIDNLKITNIDTIMDSNESGEFTAYYYEFKRDVNIYLSNLLTSQVRSLSEVIESNKQHAEEEKLNEYGQDGFIQANKTSLPDEKYTKIVEKLATLCREGLEKLMSDNNLDAIVVPGYFGSSVLAIGGYPGIVVPAGFDPDGVPFGIMFGGIKGSDAKLIEIAYAFEQATKVRRPPPQQTSTDPESSMDVSSSLEVFNT